MYFFIIIYSTQSDIDKDFISSYHITRMGKIILFLRITENGGGEGEGEILEERSLAFFAT